GRSAVVERVWASGISARVAGQLALGNQVTTNSSACSTGTEAIIEGLERIRSGRAERMLCGGVGGVVWGGGGGGGEPLYLGRVRCHARPDACIERRPGARLASHERERRRL